MRLIISPKERLPVRIGKTLNSGLPDSKPSPVCKPQAALQTALLPLLKLNFHFLVPVTVLLMPLNPSKLHCSLVTETVQWFKYIEINNQDRKLHNQHYSSFISNFISKWKLSHFVCFNAIIPCKFVIFLKKVHIKMYVQLGNLLFLKYQKYIFLWLKWRAHDIFSVPYFYSF